MYMYILSSTVSFLVSQLFNAVRHAGRFKLGLKSAKLYVVGLT